MATMDKIDDNDRKIIEILSGNARISLRDIKKQVDLSPSSIRNRMERLVNLGIIRKYTVDVDYRKLGYDIQINHIENPRKELEEHYYNPTYQGLIDLGVTPHFLTEEVIENMFEVVKKYKNEIRKDVIFRGVKW